MSEENAIKDKAADKTTKTDESITEDKSAVKKTESKKEENNQPAESNKQPAESNKQPADSASKDPKETAKKVWNKFLHFFKRTDYSVNQNLRLSGICLAVILLIGMFQPFMGLNFGASIKTGNVGVEKVSNKTFPIIPNNTAYLSFNIGDMVAHKPFKEYKIAGTPIQDIQVLGINLYDFCTTQFPDFSALQKVNDTLDSEWIQFFESEQFVTLCNKFLGDKADMVTNVASNLVQLTNKTSDGLDKVIATLNKMNTSKANLVAAVKSFEGTFNMVCNVIFGIMAIFLLGVVFMCFKKLPRYLGAIVMTPIAAIFLIIGIGFLVVNGFIGSFLGSLDQTISDAVMNSLASMLPDLTSVIGGILNADMLSLDVSCGIVAGAGWWIITICMTGCTVLAYIIGKRNKGLAKADRK